MSVSRRLAATWLRSVSSSMDPTQPSCRQMSFTTRTNCSVCSTPTGGTVSGAGLPSRPWICVNSLPSLP